MIFLLAITFLQLASAQPVPLILPVSLNFFQDGGYTLQQYAVVLPNTFADGVLQSYRTNTVQIGSVKVGNFWVPLYSQFEFNGRLNQADKTFFIQDKTFRIVNYVSQPDASFSWAKYGSDGQCEASGFAQGSCGTSYNHANMYVARYAWVSLYNTMAGAGYTTRLIVNLQGRFQTQGIESLQEDPADNNNETTTDLTEETVYRYMNSTWQMFYTQNLYQEKQDSGVTIGLAVALITVGFVLFAIFVSLLYKKLKKQGSHTQGSHTQGAHTPASPVKATSPATDLSDIDMESLCRTGN